MAGDSTDGWGTALRSTGLAVRDVGASSLVDEPGSIGQFVDVSTGAVMFARQGDAAMSGDGQRLVRVVSRGGGRLTAPSWERDFRAEQLRWFRWSDRDLDTQSAALDLDGLARLSVGPSLLLLHDWLGRTDFDFAALDDDLHAMLSDRYEGRVVGYDHHTLCVEPAQNAQALGATLSQLKRPLVLDVVGLGRGGLVARELAERRQFSALSIDKVVTVATPHTGTPLADSGGLLSLVNRFAGSRALTPDMMRGVASVLAHVVDDTAGVLNGLGALGVYANTSLESLNTLPSPPGTRYFMIAGTSPGWKPNGALPSGQHAVVGGSLDDEPNDGFVTVRSALAMTAEGAHVRVATSAEVPGRHDELLATSAVRERLRSWLFETPLPERATGDVDHVVVRKGTATTRLSRDVDPATVGSPEGDGAPNPEQPQQLTIGLLHASLEHADGIVLVGHFAGSPLSGAEERLDDCLDHRLSRAQVGRDYPEAIGDFRDFPGDEQTRPAGAIVVGLGPVGELTASRLTTVVTRAVVRYASEQRDRERVRRNATGEPHEPVRLELSSVLIGTSRSSGLTVEGSVRAIVAGVVFANRRLRPNREGTGGVTESVAITKLTFVERYEDSVELAAQALEQLKFERGQAAEGDGVTFVATPRSREGAAGPNPPSDAANAVWTRVSIQQSTQTADGLSELTYSMMARMARAEQITHRVDQALVDSLVGQSINRTSDPRIGSTLYELLLPHDLKQPIGSGSHLQLLVDETTADYPYELLTPREEAFRSSRPLAVSAGLLRQFIETRDRRQGPARASGPTALVIGNPPAGPNFASLWGAHSEAVEVAGAFSAAANPQWDVTARIWDGRGVYAGTKLDDRSTTDPAENVVHELMTGAWRVVHIAAHGSIQGDGDTAQSGVVLSEDRRLSPVMIGQLSIVPDLVVVNACHLGVIARQLAGMNKVAASLARSLMQIGVRAVIVAGWAVDDQAAAMFANVLYDELLAGRELGDALLLARSQVHRADDGGLTWGAYQAYGDPGFRLAPRRQARGGAAPSLTISELRRRIRATAGTVSDRTSSVSSLRRAITAVGNVASESLGVGAELEAQLLAFGRDQLYVTSSRAVQADISADLAVAWTELGHFDRAVRHYRRSLRGGGKSVPATALEQLANLSMRWAARREDDRLRRKLVADACSWLAAVDALGRNAERLALRGSFHKKRASLTTPPNQEDVEKAAEMYRAAHELDSKQRAARAPKPRPGVRVPTNTYFEFNARQLTAIARLANSSVPKMAVDDTGWSADDAPMDFWERNAIGDWMLTKLVETALGEGSMDEGTAPPTVEQLERKYRDAFLLRSSAANRSSVTEHLYDIADLLPEHVPLRNELRVAAGTLRAIDDSPVRPSRVVDNGVAPAP